jgi:hypothetical protein
MAATPVEEISKLFEQFFWERHKPSFVVGYLVYKYCIVIMMVYT